MRISDWSSDVCSSDVGGAVDYYQWAALLRSVSSFRIYRQIYRDTIQPTRVAELLNLRSDMPRSLHACFAELVDLLPDLLQGYRRNYLSVRLRASMLMTQIGSASCRESVCQ